MLKIIDVIIEALLYAFAILAGAVWVLIFWGMR